MHSIRKNVVKALCFFICSNTFHTAFSQTHKHPHDHARSLNMDVKVLFPSATPDRIILNLTATPETSVAVNWRTDSTINKGEIQFAQATDGTQFQKNIRTINAISENLKVKYPNEPEINAYYHSGVIENLQPGALYVYRVGYDKHWSEWFQMRLPGNKPGRPLSFLYFGDAQNDVKSQWSRVIREAYKTMPEVSFMLHAGDLINRHDHDVEWGEWFYAGSYIHATVPSVMTPGNHEYGKGKLSPQWRPQFNLPVNGPKGLEETCYEVNYSDLKVISLNAEEIDESEHFANAQAKWLDSVLTNNPRKWTAITLHYPFYSTKPNRDNIELRKRFKPIIDKHKVDIVLQGHDHAYGRGVISNSVNGQGNKNQASGTVYVVSVSGPKMYDISNDPWMNRKASNTQLFQILTVEGNSLLYKAFTATGELYDSFELKKQPGKPNVLVNKIPKTPEKN
ncbi:metallophosphoesterase family protein [Emticicia sp. 21SJ11W-3]|uniref:purple acid phosphatase family protein n=1 Tax=Emticicia sp. 21SJ11W-3 TaxID=2916755 RepID=UPI00209CDBB0|nr:metallophosphoesterase family protein [Emticicia sp. 21SJ11W-3]UTA67120.1 metallophosphoesterase family protein [Emticicia sp. 21SJ11W-3]